MDTPFPDYAQMANLPLMEELYKKYLEDPSQVEPSWRFFFQGIDFSGLLVKSPSVLRIFLLIQSYRRFGHLAAHINPLQEAPAFPIELGLQNLGFSEAELRAPFPTLGLCGKEVAPLQEIIDELKRIYTSAIGFEYMDLGHIEIEKWLSNRLEGASRPATPQPDKLSMWESLSKAEWFEQFLHRKYAGQTRFSLEGGETMIPVLLEMVKAAGERDVEEIIIGMAHRGRLNVLAQVVEKPYFSLLEEFENDLILSAKGQDDVKYHMGFSKERVLSSGKKVTISMAPNPSHLESVDPVVLGQVRALQVFNADDRRQKIMALLIHGDAALAGQGVIYETLQLMNLPSYSIGGTIHLVVNNQIGYTTTSNEGRSTRYCTDIAKAFGCPVFHVNGEDPESCVFAAQLAIEIRQQFQCDVFIDLLCYRKYGHNEGDEPSYTQPLEYQTIRAKTSIPSLYTEKLLNEGSLQASSIEALETQFKQTLSQALETLQSATPKQKVVSTTLLEPFASAVDGRVLEQVVARYSQIPETFHVHSKLKKWLQDRFAAPALDWASAECLAFGSLLLESISIRLAGQDAKRGTFSQRHLILIDEKTGESYSPLQGLSVARLDVVNTPLTEYAGMAFEYGYSWSSPQTLVLWEAQYGDFNNGAQIIIDQYLVSAEHKWGTSSSLTLLLPHAYEGAGPEHSSARLERFLQLSAEENIQVVNASTPAQYFHVLRRQAKRATRRPLILFTPKSLLRSPGNVSPLNEFTSGCFQEILDDPTPQISCTKLLFCSGKIFYELYAEKIKRQLTDVSILRIEQLYPFHHEQFKKLLMNYQHAQHLRWVQEEPENAGAWNFIRPCIEQHLPQGARLEYIGRPANPTTATGSHKKHKQEQQALIEQALGALPQTPLKDGVL